MNKIVLELAKQAGLKKKHGSDREYIGDFDWREFAELIVKECVNRIEQNRSSGENTDSWTITRDMAFHQMKEDLKKHFGVTE